MANGTVKVLSCGRCCCLCCPILNCLRDDFGACAACRTGIEAGLDDPAVQRRRLAHVSENHRKLLRLRAPEAILAISRKAIENARRGLDRATARAN
jgi:hypothetical protein